MSKQPLTVEIEAELLDNQLVTAALKNLWMVIDHQQGGSIDNSETLSYRTLGDVIRAPDFIY